MKINYKYCLFTFNIILFKNTLFQKGSKTQLTIIGIFFTVQALFKIQYSLNLKGISDKWKYNFVTGLVNLSLGILIILQPLHSLELFLKIVGVVLIVFAIAELIETIKVMKTLDSVDVKELDFIEKTSSKKFRENYND